MEDIILLILQVIIEAFGEGLLESAPEVLMEILLHTIRAGQGEPCNRWVAIIGYLLLGQIFGFLSVWIFPHNFIHLHSLRLLNLFLSPLVPGYILTSIGLYRVRHGKGPVRLDKFGYAYAFGFSMALVRYWFAK